MTDDIPDPEPGPDDEGQKFDFLGLRAAHDAQEAKVRPGFVDPPHDRPDRSELEVNMLGIRAAIYRYRHHKHAFDVTQPPGPELHGMLVESHGLLEGQDDTASVYLRRQIEELIPALRDRGQITDTQRLDWLIARPLLAKYEITREKIDLEMALEQKLNRGQQR